MEFSKATNMQISIPVPMFLVKAWWFFNDQCGECGGHVSEHINGHYYCDDCDTKNG